MSKARAAADNDEEEEEARPPPPTSARWLSRHGSLRQAAGQLSRRLAARLSLTRQRSLGGALGRRSQDADADAEETDGDPYEDSNFREAPPRQLASPVRFSLLPKATSSYDGFRTRGRLLSNQQQRSCDSHDDSVASPASAAGSSRGSSGDFGAAWACAAGATKMDMMNFGKKPDEPDEDDKKDDASIKGLWKRAFNTLKIRDKEKTPKKKKGGKDEDDAADDVDPVYSLLKRAADKGVQKCTGCTPEAGGSPQAGGKSGAESLQSGLAAAAASTSQEIPLCRGEDCPCLCHSPLQLLVPSITLNDLKPRPKVRKGKSRSKSLAQAPQSPPPPPQQPQSPTPPLPQQLQLGASGTSTDATAWGSRGRLSSLRESGSRGRQKLE